MIPIDILHHQVSILYKTRMPIDPRIHQNYRSSIPPQNPYPCRPPGMALPSNNLNAQTFGLFFEQWLTNQESYLQELVRVIECGSDEENDLRRNGLIQEVMAHLNQYYEAKERVASENIFLVFTQTWFSSFERAHLWMGGFRPGLAIQIVINSVLDLTEDQSERINTLMTRIKEEENELTGELARVQAGLVSPSMVELARNMGRQRNGHGTTVDSALERLAVSMETLLRCADFLRKRTIIKLVETLKPAQTVRFLAAPIDLQLRISRWGMQRDHVPQPEA